MVTTLDLREAAERNDRIIQAALREIDSHVLAEAMIDMSAEEREIIYRNMSKRACTLEQEEIAGIEKTTPLHRKTKSREYWHQLLTRSEKFASRSVEHATRVPPDLNTSKPEELVATFTALNAFIRSNGALKLEGAGARTDDPLLRRAIDLTVDGWDPMLVRSILERMKETMIADLRRHCEMIIEGIASIQENDVPQVTEMKLRVFLSE
jgi:hypothetical protein